MRRLLAAVLISGGMLCLPAPAWADGFIAPYFGVNFSGDTTKNSLNFGGSLGFLGKSAGFEVDFGYTPDFFGNDPLQVDGKATTLMSNVLVGGRRHGASPYIVIGVGLIRTDVSGVADILDIHATKNNWGGDIGGGMFVGSGKVTFRGDVRYFKSFESFGHITEIITGDKLGFWRATAGIGLMW